MKKDISPHKLILLFLLLLLPSLAFSNLTKEEACLYRENGYDAQKRGDLEAAFICYQKAIAIDPAYSIAYNDLGVLCERKGDKGMAKVMYQRALEIDSGYVEPYYNLAALYEAENDFLKAAFYWKQRLYLGDPNSAKTAVAREHLRQIGQIYPYVASELSQYDAKELLAGILSDKKLLRAREIHNSFKGRLNANREEEMKELLLEMNNRKSFLSSDDTLKKSQECFAKGQEAYNSGNYAGALRSLNDAIYLNPDNKEAQDLLEDSRNKLLLN